MKTATSLVEQKASISVLLGEPAEPLTAEAYQKAQAFARGLFVGHVNRHRVLVRKTLGEIFNLQTKAHIQFYCVEYFADAVGASDAALFGLKPSDSSKAWALTLRNVNNAAHIAVNERKAIAGRSRQWRRQQLAEMLKKPAALDDRYEPFNCIYVNYQPATFLERLEGFVAYKQFYDSLANKLSFDGALGRAQRAILTVHQHRVDGLLRDELSLVESLGSQLARSDLSNEELQWLSRLQKVLPVITSLQKASNEPAELQAIEALLEKAIAQRAVAPVLDQAVLIQLDDIRWNAEQLKHFIEAMLAKWQLLSKYQATWDEVDARSDPALDGLFQVVVRPKNSLAVSSTKRVIFVPFDFNRTLTSVYPAGCLPVVAHELTHALQALADDELGKVIPLATIKGHCYRPGREAGGVYQESIVQEHYFGHLRPLNLHYARAMAAKLRGKNQLAVIRAFYNSYIQENPTEEQAALLSVDRALRLYRSGDYYTPAGMIAQAELLNELYQARAGQATQFALAGSSFSMQDALLLRRFGLLKFSELSSCKPADDVVSLYISEFMN